MSTNSYFTACPRCGTRAYEKLPGHSHCIECLYVEDSYFDLDTAYLQALRIEKDLNSGEVIQLPKRAAKKKGAAL